MIDTQNKAQDAKVPVVKIADAPVAKEVKPVTAPAPADAATVKTEAK